MIALSGRRAVACWSAANSVNRPRRTSVAIKATRATVARTAPTTGTEERSAAGHHRRCLLPSHGEGYPEYLWTNQGVPHVTLLAAQNIAVVPPAADWQTGSAGSVQVALLVHAVEQTA